jgi:hypothetical protein
MALFNYLTAMTAWLVLTTAACIALSDQPTAVTSSFATLLLLFFNNLNIIIALCEIVLFFHIQTIKSDYQIFRKKYEGNEWGACVALLTMPMPMPQLFSGRQWSKMWSTYALYDPSYQNHESFGFFIDIGNGFSTIPPSILMNVALIRPSMCNHLLVGCVCLASYWQIIYGTIIYVASFVFNKRYEGKSLLEVCLFVGISNSLWFFFPLIGVYYCVVMLRDGNLDAFS